MRFLVLALVVSLAPIPASALVQNLPAGTFKHIIIVVQENRTPDNLFGAWATGGPCPIANPFAGADINDGGHTIENHRAFRSGTSRRP